MKSHKVATEVPVMQKYRSDSDTSREQVAPRLTPIIVSNREQDENEIMDYPSPLTSVADSDSDDVSKTAETSPLHQDSPSELPLDDSVKDAKVESEIDEIPRKSSTKRSPGTLRSKKRRRAPSPADHNGSASTNLPRSANSTRKGSRPRPIISSVLCHQCRRPNKWAKMTCSNMLEFGQCCNKTYCAYCVLKRYPDIDFNALSKEWTCPWCQNVCNCTVCCNKRGEIYVSTRFAKIDEEALRMATVGESARQRLSTSVEPRRPSKRVKKLAATKPSTDFLTKTANLLEKDGVARGTYWAAVFSVEGDRIGKGFIGDSASEIIVRLDAESVVSKGQLDSQLHNRTT